MLSPARRSRWLVDSETTLALNIALVEYLGELWTVVTFYRPSLVCSLLRQSLPRSRQSDTFRISRWYLRAAKVEAETKRPPEGGLSVVGVARSGEARRRFPPIRHEAYAEETQDHHRPSGRFGYGSGQILRAHGAGVRVRVIIRDIGREVRICTTAILVVAAQCE